MKTQINTKAAHAAGNSLNQRVGGVRPSVARSLEHRYERRKIREQLRRLDWALNIEEDVID